MQNIQNSLEIKRIKARHKICKNCFVEFCSITPTGYRTSKKVSCTKECASLLMVKKRKENGSFFRTEEQIEKARKTCLKKDSKYGEKRKKFLKQKEERGLDNYDRKRYKHWTQTPKGSDHLRKINKDRKFTEETKKMMSLTRAKMLKENPSLIYSNSNGGIREDLNSQYFRSNWEANYARILNMLSIEWEYEKYSFSLSDGSTYTPDFKIGEKEFVELKGWLDEKSKKKIKLFLEEYPQYDLDLIDEHKYYSLRNLFKHKIEKWEGK